MYSSPGTSNVFNLHQSSELFAYVDGGPDTWDFEEPIEHTNMPLTVIRS